MAYKGEWQSYGTDGRGKRLVDAPYDARIEPVAAGWRIELYEHVNGGVRKLFTRTFKMLRLAKSSAIARIGELRQ